MLYCAYLQMFQDIWWVGHTQPQHGSFRNLLHQPPQQCGQVCPYVSAISSRVLTGQPDLTHSLWKETYTQKQGLNMLNNSCRLLFGFQNFNWLFSCQCTAVLQILFVCWYDITVLLPIISLRVCFQKSNIKGQSFLHAELWVIHLDIQMHSDATLF